MGGCGCAMVRVGVGYVNYLDGPTCRLTSPRNVICVDTVSVH